MKPRIMASSAEISMTPIRMMSRSVMGMADCGFSYACQNGADLGESAKRAGSNLCAPRVAGKPQPGEGPNLQRILPKMPSRRRQGGDGCDGIERSAAV